jgi:crotonobetainyl-CoA:carnitine CoA-transferase CaiB-like acyl-CoA transferase
VQRLVAIHVGLREARASHIAGNPGATLVTGYSHNGPLAGIKIVDFGQYIAGPGASMILADQGAEVIRVEKPDGPSLDSPANAVLNRGKRSVVLDLKNSEQIEIARELIAAADVVVENFRPGVMERLGIGYERMASLNPRLVYLSLPGFSREDAEMASTPAWEGVVAASMGQFTDMGLNRILMGIEASYSPLTLSSAYASVLGAMAVVLALRARETSRSGDHIEVPLAAALMEGLAYNSLWMQDLPLRYKSLREREIERRMAAQLPMDLSYGQLQSYLDPFYRTYACKDGRPFYVVSGSHARHAVRALKVLGLWDEMIAAGLPYADPYLPMNEWGADCTLKAYPITEPWASRLTKRMAEAFLQRTSYEWERLFGEAGAPGASHRTTKEWLSSEHPREAGLLIEVDDPQYGKMLQPGPVAWLSGCPPVAGSKPAPARQEDPASIVAEFSANPVPHSPPVNGGPRPWLEGITILDMSNVIAGPTIAGTLARFGARVIKIDSVSPTYDPWNTIIFGIYSNQGKESALVDVKTEKGREILSKLLERVDIVTINCASKQLHALGLDFECLRRAWSRSTQRLPRV